MRSKETGCTGHQNPSHGLHPNKYCRAQREAHCAGNFFPRSDHRQCAGVAVLLPNARDQVQLHPAVLP